MALNFPLSPAVGQLYPTVAVPGTPQYAWDGSTWNSNATPSVDALALNGMQINGRMDISQELGTTGRTTDGYVIDMWRVDHAGTMAYSAAPNVTIAPGFANHLAVTISTAQTSLAAGDYMVVGHLIEGYRISRLAWGTANAQPITLSFWTAHHRTGIYTGAVRNAPTARSCAFSYTQNAADTWEYKTVTLPGDISGTWIINNAQGMSIFFAMACGTTYTAPANGVWAGVNYLAGSGQINGVAATTDVFRLTGVTMLPGSSAPTAASSPNILRPADQELMLCRRYWQRFDQLLLTDYAVAGGQWYNNVNFFPTMRVTPTMTTVCTSLGNCTFTSSSPQSATSGFVVMSMTGAGYGFAYSNITADARL